MPVWVDLVCSREACGKEFRRERYQVRYSAKKGRKPMCSRECVRLSLFGEGNPRRRHSIGGAYWTTTVRSLYAERGYACQACPWTRCVDACHIVDRADGGPSTPSNLILLCPNHHRLFDRGELNVEEQDAIIISMRGFGYRANLFDLYK